MAERVLINIAEGIIGRLGSLALQEIGLIWGIQDELKKLKKTVEGFQAVLVDAEEKQANNEVKQANNEVKLFLLILIYYLRHVVSESNVGKPLKDKQHLHSLTLRWKYGEDVRGVDEEDIIKSMEVLQPHSNLKQLEVYFYGGVRFASWFSSLINIVNLTLAYCRRCQRLPPLDHLPSLKSLYLRGLKKLEYISENESSISMSDEMMRISFFPSLEELSMSQCPVLKGWWRAHTHNSASSSSSTENLSLPSFPRLSTLEIHNCPNLTSLPGLPCLNELIISDCPMLSERCKKETGEDRFKIAHIPHIHIY